MAVISNSMLNCLKKHLFEYLAEYPEDSFGWSFVPASKVVKDTGISREDLWEIINHIKKEAFLDMVTTNIPSAEGLLSVTITKRGRLWLKGEDYSHIPQRREKIYNLL
jgi:hypothetical protein